MRLGRSVALDILTSLMFSATLRKAAALEQWLVNHRHCDPRPALEFSDDATFERGNCSCGEVFECTVIIDVVPKVYRKWPLL